MPYAPEAGDLIWTDFDPPVGRERSGRRPALVVSAGRVLPSDRIRDRLPDYVSHSPIRHQRRLAAGAAGFRGNLDQSRAQHRHAGPPDQLRRSRGSRRNPARRSHEAGCFDRTLEWRRPSSLPTAATSAASGASPRPSNTASSAIGYLDAGLPKIAAIAWYRLPFETVAVASIDGEFCQCTHLMLGSAKICLRLNPKARLRSTGNLDAAAPCFDAAGAGSHQRFTKRQGQRCTS